MKKDTIFTRYKSSKELNKQTPSTGAVTCYDGVIIDGKTNEEWEDQFIEIADCHSKIKLHRASYDDEMDWFLKVSELQNEITNYLKHLRKKMVQNQTPEK